MKIALTAFALGLIALTGCAASSSDEGTSTDSDLVAPMPPVKVEGAWRIKEGASSSRAFEGIVFNADGSFFADVFTGIYCVTTPCPTSARIEGTYRVVGRILLLAEKTGADGNGYLPADRYSVSRIGDSLRIDRAGTEGAGSDLELVNSYCAEPVDCEGQPIIHPMCVGHWTCSVQSACGYSCGVAPVKDEVWPSDRTQLIAENKGGGFTPPPPAGSACAVGASKYTLDIATKKLSWEVCSFTDWSTPFHLETGSKVLTAAELKKVDVAMNAVAITKGDICGADKPWLELQVTSASAGTREFADSFYSCMQGDRTYVDNIDGVFGAFRNIVGE